MQATVRPAEPRDADFIAWVMLTASRSHCTLSFWDLALPGPESLRLDYLSELAVTEPASFGHYSGFLVAENDEGPLAALSAYDPAEKTIEGFTEAILTVLRNRDWPKEHQGLVFSRIAPVMTCNPETPEGRWVVEWVAARPEARGRGVIQTLLEAILEQGRERGLPDSQLGVLLGNTRAFTAYERAGYQLHDEKTDAGFEKIIGSPGIARMVRTL